jgi:HAD superfamily hydrolase (TIGR01509 family)
MPFVEETLEFFSTKNLKLALVTSSPRKDVEAIFERNGLGKYFDLIITRTEVTKSKPDPESYNLCKDKLGFPANECLVFEDTLNGAKAAKAAGLTCYAIQSNEDEHDNLRIADHLFLDFNAAKEHLINNNLIG